MFLRSLAVAGVLTVSLATAAGAVEAPATFDPATFDRATFDSATFDSATFDNVKARCLEEIDRRFVTIDKFQSQIASASHLTDEHEAQLAAEVDAAEAGLIGLRPQIEAATTPDELRTLCPKIVEDFRVYVLEGPTVHLTIGADRAVVAADRLDEIAGRLATAIADAEANGYDVGDAPGLLDDMESSINVARGLATPVPNAVIPLTPADYNSGAAQPVLADAALDMTSAKDSLGTAVDDARAIVEILRAL